VVWYLLVALVVLAPAGVRALTWQLKRPPAADPSLADAGRELFTHEWQPRDPLANGGDGLGPVYNAKSCVACHNQGGVGGSGVVTHSVPAYPTQPPHAGAQARGAVTHADTTDERFRETLTLISPDFPAVSKPTLEQLVRLPGRSNHCLDFPTGV